MLAKARVDSEVLKAREDQAAQLNFVRNGPWHRWQAKMNLPLAGTDFSKTQFAM